MVPISLRPELVAVPAVKAMRKWIRKLTKRNKLTSSPSVSEDF